MKKGTYVKLNQHGVNVLKSVYPHLKSVSLLGTFGIVQKDLGKEAFEVKFHTHPPIVWHLLSPTLAGQNCMVDIVSPPKGLGLNRPLRAIRKGLQQRDRLA